MSGPVHAAVGLEPGVVFTCSGPRGPLPDSQAPALARRRPRYANACRPWPLSRRARQEGPSHAALRTQTPPPAPTQPPPRALLPLTSHETEPDVAGTSESVLRALKGRARCQRLRLGARAGFVSTGPRGRDPLAERAGKPVQRARIGISGLLVSQRGARESGRGPRGPSTQTQPLPPASTACVHQTEHARLFVQQVRVQT